MKRIIAFLALIVFSVFINSNILSAKEIGDNVDNNLSNEKEIIIDKNKKIEQYNSSIEDIFGDEQTFPFVAGLGKNAAH